MPDKTENLAKKVSRREQRRQKFFQEIFKPTIFGKKSRKRKTEQSSKMAQVQKGEGVVIDWCLAFCDGFGIIFYTDRN